MEEHRDLVDGGFAHIRTDLPPELERQGNTPFGDSGVHRRASIGLAQGVLSRRSQATAADLNLKQHDTQPRGRIERAVVKLAPRRTAGVPIVLERLVLLSQQRPLDWRVETAWAAQG